LDITEDWEGTCAKADSILNGTFDVHQPGISQSTQWILQHLQRTVTDTTVPPDITTSDMLGKIKVWAEKTSTLPATQVHLGHAKAYIAEPNFAMDTPEGEKLTQQREMLIKGHVACLNYALKFGYVYKRWYTIVHYAKNQRVLECSNIYIMRLELK